MYQHKEPIEWISAWSDNAPNTDLPRVLLVGDSICMGYQQAVREKLRGVCYVDYISNTYAVDNQMYRRLFKQYYADEPYALVHFNHGLHGGHMSVRTYQREIEKLLKTVTCKLVIANSTVVYEAGNGKLDETWGKLVSERNQALSEIARAMNCPVNDLYTSSVNVPKEYRNQDGIHYLAEGYEILAQQVADAVRKALAD